MTATAQTIPARRYAPATNLAPTLADAYNIKKLIREAEALSDETMLACAKLKQAMLQARQNPAIPVDTGQRAIMRLSQAEQQAMAMSTNLLRVHAELNKVATVHAAADLGIPTELDNVVLEAAPLVEARDTI